MNRRSFLSVILAASVAPAIVRGGILMPVRSIILPTADDTAYVQSFLDRGLALPAGFYRISRPLRITRDGTIVSGSGFEFSGLAQDDPLVDVNANNVVVQYCSFDDKDVRRFWLGGLGATE